MNFIPDFGSFGNGGARGEWMYFRPGERASFGAWPWAGRCFVPDLSMPVDWERRKILRAAGSSEVPRIGTVQTRADLVAYVETPLRNLFEAADEHVAFSEGCHEGRIIQPGHRRCTDGRSASLVVVPLPDAAAEGSLAEAGFTAALAAMLAAAVAWNAPYTVEAWGAFHVSTFRAPTDSAGRTSVLCGPVYREGVTAAAQPALYAPDALRMLLAGADRVLIATHGADFGPGEDWHPSPDDFIVKIFAQPWCVEEWSRVAREHAPGAAVTYRIAEAQPMRPRVKSSLGWRTAAEQNDEECAEFELAQQRREELIRTVWRELTDEGFEIKPTRDRK